MDNTCDRALRGWAEFHLWVLHAHDTSFFFFNSYIDEKNNIDISHGIVKYNLKA